VTPAPSERRDGGRTIKTGSIKMVKFTYRFKEGREKGGQSHLLFLSRGKEKKKWERGQAIYFLPITVVLRGLITWNKKEGYDCHV